MVRLFLKKIATAVRMVDNSWWPVLAIVVLASLVLYQRWQMTHPRAPQFIHRGERVKEINVRTLQRVPVLINWKRNDRGTVIYYTSPDCIWCQRNAEAANIAYKRASALGYQFIGVSFTADGLSEYLVQHKVQFPVYVDSDHSAAKVLRVAGTPETIFVSFSGVVQDVLVGAYKGKNATVLRKALDLKLPEVPAA